MNWYEKLDFLEDPFSTKKGDFIDKAVGLENAAEELAYHVEAGNMVLVEGKKGTGKTALLFTAVERFKGERKVVYFDCSKDKVDIRKLMQNKYGVVGKMLSLTPKNMIVMLDNFRELSKRDLALAKYYFDHKHIRSLVFAGNGQSALPPSIKDRIGNRIIKLKPLSEKDAVELARNRLGSLDVLTEDAIRKIYRKSGKDAKAFLENCSRVCEAAVNAGAEKATEEHLKEL